MVEESPSEGWRNEDTWAQAAVAIAIILVVGFAAASIWVIAAPDDAARLQRVGIAGPFGIFGGAAVTFCTVVWRGLISARQANSQQRQIDHLTEQIAATDDNNLVRLLLDGSELLAEEAPPKIAAGITALKSVAGAPRDTLAVEAMDLMVEYLAAAGQQEHDDQNVRRAIAAVSAVNRATKRRSNSPAWFFKNSNNLNEVLWDLLVGARLVRYREGAFVGVDISLDAYTGNHDFFRVDFQECTIDVTSNAAASFRSCTFNKCNVRRLPLPALLFADVQNCDFSGYATEVTGDEWPDLRAGNNFYDIGDPPICKRDWSRNLHTKSIF